MGDVLLATSVRLVVGPLARHLATRLPGRAAQEAAVGFMRTAASRVGRPVAWDEDGQAPALEAPCPRRERALLLQVAAHLDDAPPRLAADAPWRALDAERDEAVNAARLHLRRTRFPHLLRAREIYLPVGFDRPIELIRSPVGETVLGSASRLLAELEQVADEARGLTPALDGLASALETHLGAARKALAARAPLVVVL